MLKCNKCYHDTLFIESGSDGLIYVKCSNCDNSIAMNIRINDTEELVLYNINMSEAYAEGKRDFIEGKTMQENPYSGSSNYQDSSTWWVKGWTEEKQQMSSVSSFLSAKKELDGEVKQITEQLDIITKRSVNIEELSKKNAKNYNTIFDLCGLIVKLLTELKSKDYWFGGPYRKDIKDIMQAISDFCEERDLTL